MALKIINLKEDIKGNGGEIEIKFHIDSKKDGFLAERIFKSIASSWGIELGIGYPEELAFDYTINDTNILSLDLETGEMLHKLKKN